MDGYRNISRIFLWIARVTGNRERLGSLLHEANPIHTSNNMKKSFIPVTTYYSPISYNAFSNYPLNDYGIRRNFQNPSNTYDIRRNFQNPSNNYNSRRDFQNPSQNYNIYHNFINPSNSYNIRRNYQKNVVDARNSPSSDLTPSMDDMSMFEDSKNSQANYSKRFF